ncbi:MAG: iron ABC transporter permease [Euzebyales bacterium]|nr:iron ABC transporter permease [Euzebyales bacterium]
MTSIADRAGLRAPPPPAGSPAPPEQPAAGGLRRPLALAGLLAALVGLVMATLGAGSVAIPLDEVTRVLLGGEPTQPAWQTIVRDVRLPRAVTALLAGAALGVAGLQMQTLFRNPLADPFILGVSSGASLGVALVVIAAGSAGTTLVGGLALPATVGVAGAAALGAGAVTTLVLVLSRRVANPATVLIVGLMAGYTVSALVSLLVHAELGQGDRIRAYIAWGFGSFAGTTWSDLVVFAPAAVAALLLATAVTKPLDALLLGERYAASMGLRVGRARVLVAVGASVLAGTVTAFCGPIGFLGVAIPHLTRGLLRSSAHRLLVPGCALVGAVVALAAGLVAQLPGRDATLPLNAVTALIGAPVVVAVLLRLRRASRAVTT